MTDYLRAAGAITTRLRESVTLVPDAQINVAASIGAAMELLQITPAVFVIPWDETVPDDDPTGMSAATEQTWLVLIVARKVEDAAYGAASLAEAGSIQFEALRSLQGYAIPLSGLGRMRRAQAPRLGAHGGMIDYEKGVSAIPLLFALPIYTTGAVNDAED